MSDSHLGFRQFTRIAPAGDEYAGLNQREVDTYRAFHWAVDTAIDSKVDLVVHSGDMFDSPRPTNRALVEAISGIKRLGEAGVPFAVIAGNHSTPRLRRTGSVFRVLEQLTNVHAVYSSYEKVLIGDVAFHGVPHTFDGDRRDESMASLVTDGDARYNIAAIHCAVSGVENHYAEISQMKVDDTEIPKDFDYVALGHLHQHHVIRKNVVYSGSLERFSFAEAKDPKGAVLVDLDNGDWEFIERQGRRMDYVKVDCTRRGYEDIERDVGKAIDGAPDGALLKIKLVDIARDEFRSMDLRKLRSSGERLLHLDISHELAESSVGAPRGERIGDLASEFEAYLRDTPVENVNKDAVLSLGLNILEEVRR